MSFFRGLRAPASLQDQEDFEDVESEPLLEAVQRPVSRASLDDPDAGHADMGTGDIEIEDFGFDQLEVRPSRTREGVKSQIDQLKTNVLNYKVPQYLDQFDRDHEKESLLVGSVTVEEIELQEIEIERKHLEDATRLADAHAERQRDLTVLEIDARERVEREWQTHAAAANARELQRLDHHRQRMAILDSAFKRAEEQLKVALERRQAEVKTYYGDLVHCDDLEEKLKGRHFELDWERAPQPLELEIHSLRGIRDKIPKGYYVLRMAMYDQLAGKPLIWEHLGSVGEDKWHTALQPKLHDGKHSTMSMDFNTSLFTVGPSALDMKPSYVFIFQLFLLRGDKKPKTREVGWGAFPLCGSNFECIDGMFKVPLLRGKMDPKLDRYQEIENMVKHDIDNWLGNLYFRSNHLERYVDGHREFDIQVDFSRFVLSAAPDDPDGKDYNEQLQLDMGEGGSQNSGAAGEGDKTDSWMQNNKPRRQSVGGSDLDLATAEQHKPKLPFVGQKALEGGDLEQARVVAYDEDGVPELAQPSEPRDDDDRSRWAVPGAPEVSYCFSSQAEVQADQREQHLAAMEAIERSKAYRATRNAEDWAEDKENYQYHIDQPVGTLNKREASSRSAYVFRSLAKDLGFANRKSMEFGFSVLMALMLLWLRMYIHYFGEFLFLKIENIVVNSFEVEAIRMKLDYDATVLQVRVELGVLLMGPALNIVCFCGMALLIFFCNFWLDSFPEYGCRAVALYGILVIFDPLFIAAENAAYLPDSYPTGDIFKLYKKFYDEEDSGITGIFMTVASYGLLGAFQTVFCYYYLLMIHMHGHTADVYARLHGDSFAFFMPDDSEVSWREVQFVCRRAKEWRGPLGELHRVQVVDYVHRDRHDAGWEDRTTAITIFQLAPSGIRTVFRQFVRLPSGAILEKFGSDRLETADASTGPKRKGRSHASGSYGVLLDAVSRPEISRRRKANGQATSAGVAGPSSLQALLNNAPEADSGGRRRSSVSGMQQPGVSVEMQPSAGAYFGKKNN